MVKNKTKNLAGLARLNPRRAGVRGYLMGFSFMEVMVAVFIFSLVIMTTTMIFSKMIKNYNRTKDIQRDMESAQQAMNLMAKTIRTSKIDSTDTSGNATSINLYDYSQNKCIIYSKSGSDLVYQETGIITEAAFSNDFGNCAGYSAVSPMANGISDLRFYKDATTTTPPVAGRVAISMQVCPAGSCAGNDQVRIQTTVTLRESGYEETGL